MNKLNRELVPNKQVLSFGEYHSSTDGRFISVTRGLATQKQKQQCYRKFKKELDNREESLNYIPFKQSNSYELWYKNELIGLCQNSSIIRDWISEATMDEDELPQKKNSKTLFLFCHLEAVFILKQHRSHDQAEYFAGCIREAEQNNLFALLTHQKPNQLEVETIDICFHSEYTTKGGANFHNQLFMNYDGPYMELTFEDLGYKIQLSIDASF
ncbi:hypothetical protein [Colwellia sp. PAMC 21821]|uniref:hypothetical protein n=1 Tax=Colwellia sp. PAMC 21821 TaxID=1816219 RepID=UPI0009C1069D|nr:hypothetical protein [Colwellia sp. PAMC 21821]ARD44440.1 hypothetical protein A3Q33_09055 [Colwellia sp. PAMC 21821]